MLQPGSTRDRLGPVSEIGDDVRVNTLCKETLTGLPKALTSTPSSTFGISWNPPGLIVPHQDLSNALEAAWEHMPAAGSPNLLHSLEPDEFNASVALSHGLHLISNLSEFN